MSLCNKIVLSSLIFLSQLFLIMTAYILYEVEIYNYLLDHEFIDESSWPKPIIHEEGYLPASSYFTELKFKSSNANILIACRLLIAHQATLYLTRMVCLSDRSDIRRTEHWNTIALSKSWFRLPE